MPVSHSTRPQHITRGVMLIVAAVFIISIQDVVFKLYRSELTLWQIFALRGVLAVPMLIALAILRGTWRGALRAAFEKWTLLRSILFSIAFLAFYAAIPFLSLSITGAANYSAPIFITLLSAFVINEPVRVRGWIGVCIGFVGVIVLLQPGTDAFSLWAVLPVMGAVFYALSHITTRARCQSVSLTVMALSLNMVMVLAGLIMSIMMFLWQPDGEIALAYPYIFGLWSAVSLTDWLILALLAGFAVVIGIMLAGAYQIAPPSTVSTFEYTYLVFVAIWDVLIFKIIPTTSSLLGMLLIVSAGLMVVQRRSAAD